jgi:hypothetical protein
VIAASPALSLGVFAVLALVAAQPALLPLVAGWMVA